MSTDLHIERPKSRLQNFAATPEYTPIEYYEDKLAILVCQIKVWNARGTEWFPAPAADKCLTLRECESIEITDSAKDLMGKAVVKFPRGTIINKSYKADGKTSAGTSGDGTQVTQGLMEVTNFAEVITADSSTYTDGTPVTSLGTNYDSKGLIDFTRPDSEISLLNPNDVAIGQRIEIRIGYAYSEQEFNQMNSADNDPNMVIAFTGFITEISATTPLELHCTNMAYALACKSISEGVSANTTLSVKDFFTSDGKFDLLKDTGIELAENCKDVDITVSGGSISENLTAADILTSWNKGGVLCMMDIDQTTGISKLRVGLAYFAGLNGGKLPNNNNKYITYNGGINTIPIIQFDWDVAQDKLKAKHNDKTFLAIEAQGRVGANKFFKLTIRKNPDRNGDDWIVEDNGEFDVVNIKTIRKKKNEKLPNGTWSDPKHPNKTDRVKMDKYTVIPYISLTPNIDRAGLIEEASQYWAKYAPNGISGSIEIFGDVFVRPTDVIGIIDPRQPDRDGYYYVESVNTTFGMNGYRRELKIPHKVMAYSNRVKIIK